MCVLACVCLCTSTSPVVQIRSPGVYDCVLVSNGCLTRTVLVNTLSIKNAPLDVDVHIDNVHLHPASP